MKKHPDLMARHRGRPFGWLAVAALAGCAASTPAPVLLSLPPAVAIDTAPAPTMAPPVTRLLAVRRVSIPEYLEARRVRYRAEASTLAEWPNTFWAERIEIGVTREFHSALRAQLPGWSLCDASCGDQPPSLALQIDLVPMDYLKGQQRLQARARITLSSTGASPQVLQTREVPYDLPTGADTPQAQAQAVTELIRQAASSAASMVLDASP